MEEQLPAQHRAGQYPAPHGGHPNPQHFQRARASPPPDPEVGGSYAQFEQPLPQFSAQSMQPPRLQQSSCCNRLLILLVFFFFLFVVALAWTAFLNLPVVADARRMVKEHVNSGAAGDAAKRRPLPAILRRYKMIKRTPGHNKEADPTALSTAFPHWRTADGAFAIEAVVNDMALGLAAVAEQLDPTQELKAFRTAPSSPSPPNPPTPPPDGDIEPEEL